MAALRLHLEGEVVERQSFLNGTRSLWIELGSDDGWQVQLALTLPRDEATPLSEGDLTMAQPERTWLGVLAGGAHELRDDEATDAQTLVVTARFAPADDAAATEAWTALTLTLRLTGDAVEADLDAH